MTGTLASMVVAGAFVLAALIDIRERRIPNALAAFVAVLGVARMVAAIAFAGEASAVLVDLAAAALGFVILLPAFRFGVMGGGDVKLLTAGILWFGAGGAALFVFVALLSGGILSLGMLIAGRVRGRAIQGGVPYAVAIAAGALVCMLARSAA